MSKLRDVFVFVLTLLFIASCQKSQDEILIGVSQSIDDEWHRQMSRELEAESIFFDGFNIEVSYANNDTSTQIKQIERFIDKRVDIIVVTPNDSKALVPVIERAYEMTIPVIVVDKSIETEKYTAFIGTNNFKLGQLVGANIKGKTSAKRIIEICNSREQELSNIRHDGLFSKLQEYKNIDYLGLLYADDDDMQSAEHLVDSLLQAEKSIDLIFAHTDKIAHAAYNSAKRVGREDEILFWGIGALSGDGGGIDLISKQILDASYIYSTGSDEILNLVNDILYHKEFSRDNRLAAPMVDESRVRILQYQNRGELSKLNSRVESLNKYLSNYMKLSQVRLYLLCAAIVVLLLGGVAIFFIIRLLRGKMYANKLLNKRNSELEEMSKELEEATQSKLRFFTNISHDIKTPLTLVTDPINYLIKNTNLTDQQTKLLSTVVKNGDILMRLVDQILDFRSYEYGKLQLSRSTVDLKKSIKGWAAAFDVTLAQSNKCVVLEVQEEHDYAISIDEKRIERVFYNILSNAVKYSIDRDRISVSLLKKGSNLVFNVTNSCNNISEADVERMFDRFYKVDESSDGSGIGLAISKSYVALHGGEISIKLIEESKIEVAVSLPITAAAQITIEEMEREEGERSKELILVVEDNDDMRSHIVNILQSEYRVIEANDGEKGLEMTKEYIPDLIVSDIMMPVMDGLSMTRIIKSELITCHIPILMLTARGVEAQKMEGYENGADGYLTKPFNFEMLMIRVRNLLDNRRLVNSRASVSATQNDERSDMTPQESTFLNKFYEIVERNIGNIEFEFENIGDELFYSRVQVYRKVKALTGESPSKILRKARLERADKLIRTTDKSIGEIAFEVGFSAPSYFSKNYKEQYGVLPSAVKR